VTSVIEVAVPADQIALSRTLKMLPDVTFEAMRTVTSGSNDVMPMLAASEGDNVPIERALRADEGIDSVSPVATLEDECVYHVEWDDETAALLHGIFQERCAVLRARVLEDKWCFRLLFPERASISECYDYCRESGIRIDVESIYDPTGAIRYDQHGLSQKQFDVLEAALERGYYEIPRNVTLGELADEFDVSHQALSERLCRAHRTLVANVVSSDLPLAAIS